MTDQAAPTSSYTMGYSEEFRQLLNRRSAETHAKHLLPHLKPGLRVLDFGCGPGTITVGLAKAVEPGEVHGIDMAESQINLARSAAEAGGHTNVTFHVGSVLELPFEDNSFDAAHCHAVLMHIPDTQAALAEVKRVLKPGGIVASRETIVASSFLEPSSEGTEAGLGIVFEPSGRQWRTSQDGERTKTQVPSSRTLRYSNKRFFRLLWVRRGRRLPLWLYSGLVLFARSNSRGCKIRAGHPGAIRHGPPRARPVEGPPGRLWSHRIRRGNRP